ncbi:MAG: RNA polymerase sigma factor [Actinobacteria bacterium]|nr:RNA polymerase sigma factor [Actinomycetota bacterium]
MDPPDKEMENIEEYLKNYKKSKNTKWFEKIYNLMMPKIYRFYYLKTFSRELSEDLTSEVFIRVYRNLDKIYLNKKTFTAWIYKIANNLLIDHFRKNKNSGLQVKLEEDLLKITAEDILIKNSGLLRKELGFTNISLLSALDKLTGLQKDVVLLKFLEDMDYDTIASIFGKRVPTIRGILFRALTRLKEETRSING